MGQFASEIQQNPGMTMGPIGTIMSAIGGMVSADTAQKSGSAQRTASYFTAAQQDQAANNVIGAGQRSAENERLKAKLLASRAIALAAAQGGDVGSPGVTNLITDIAGRGAYNAGVALYDAEDQARMLKMGATASRYEGDVAAAGGKSKAAAYLFGSAGTLLQAGSLFAKYGRGGPTKNISATDEWAPKD
ncbi:MAG TPA: hypothetical protein PLO69_14570 [Gammaproteobacteria bacterium]|nr:hypothetical protein [Gammaproteobacteria bacterium]